LLLVHEAVEERAERLEREPVRCGLDALIGEELEGSARSACHDPGSDTRDQPPETPTGRGVPTVLRLVEGIGAIWRWAARTALVSRRADGCDDARAG
jgi:hypothetical protein